MEVALTVPLTGGADTVENFLQKVVIHTGSRGTGLVASANATAVSARAPSRRRKSNRKRQQVGELLSRFDPSAEYIDSTGPHGHTVCVAFFHGGLGSRGDSAQRRWRVQQSRRPRLHLQGGTPHGLARQGPSRVGERPRRLFPRTIPYIVT